MRRLAALAALALVPLAVPALAAPAVGAESGAALSIHLSTPSGKHLLQLVASSPQGGAAVLRLRVVPEQGPAVRLTSQLPAGAFRTTATGATLSVRLGGYPLRVVWSSGPTVVSASLGNHGSNGFDAEGWTTVGSGGTAQVRLGGLRCRTESVVIGPVLAYRTAEQGGSLSRGLGLDLRRGRCVPPASSLP